MHVDAISPAAGMLLHRYGGSQGVLPHGLDSMLAQLQASAGHLQLAGCCLLWLLLASVPSLVCLACGSWLVRGGGRWWCWCWCECMAVGHADSWQLLCACMWVCHHVPCIRSCECVWGGDQLQLLCAHCMLTHVGGRGGIHGPCMCGGTASILPPLQQSA